MLPPSELGTTQEQLTNLFFSLEICDAIILLISGDVQTGQLSASLDVALEFTMAVNIKLWIVIVS